MCEYIFSNGDKCQRARYMRSANCVFHSENISDRVFFQELFKLIKKRDGDWQGFNFPKNISYQGKIFKRDKPESTDKELDRRYSVNINFPVDISESKIDSVDLKNIAFNRGLSARNIKFSNVINVNQCYFVNLDLSHCVFERSVYLNWLTVEENFSLIYSNVKERFELSGFLYSRALFAETIFHGQAYFVSRKNLIIKGKAAFEVQSASISGSSPLTTDESRIKIVWNKLKSFVIQIASSYKKELNEQKTKLSTSIQNFKNRFPHEDEDITAQLFYSEVEFRNAVFEKPKQVTFDGVDLRKTSFVNIDLLGVRFVRCNFYQVELNRNGIFDEVKFGSSHYHVKQRYQPRIESSCRSIRLTLEDQKDFSTANDFFVGEMNAKRRQLPFIKCYLFSVLALYRYVSKYGTSPIRCLIFIIAVAISHSLIVDNYISTNLPTWNNSISILGKGILNLDANQIGESFDSLIGSIERSIRNLVYSLETMTLKKKKIFELTEPDTFIAVSNLIAGVIGPVLTVLFGLTVRTRIKRS